MRPVANRVALRLSERGFIGARAEESISHGIRGDQNVDLLEHPRLKLFLVCAYLITVIRDQAGEGFIASLRGMKILVRFVNQYFRVAGDVSRAIDFCVKTCVSFLLVNFAPDDR